MADKIAAQREARRRKLSMNAEARMNKLLGKKSELDDPAQSEELKENSETTPTEATSSDGKNRIEETPSPYNLRHRGRNSSPSNTTTTSTDTSSELPSDAKKSNVPYKVVEDPEVPDLAEFLASQEAAKAAGEKSRKINSISPKRRWSTAQYIEAVKIIGLIMIAFVSKYSNLLGLSFLFESIFLPFVVFEIVAGYIINVQLQDKTTLQTSGSLLSSALVLCGIKPELISVYIKIMNHVTLITNDFFTYVFFFILIHLFV